MCTNNRKQHKSWRYFEIKEEIRGCDKDKRNVFSNKKKNWEKGGQECSQPCEVAAQQPYRHKVIFMIITGFRRRRGHDPGTAAEKGMIPEPLSRRE
jgi:hypothetical protein